MPIQTLWLCWLETRVIWDTWGLSLPRRLRLLLVSIFEKRNRRTSWPMLLSEEFANNSLLLFYLHPNSEIAFKTYRFFIVTQRNDLELPCSLPIHSREQPFLHRNFCIGCFKCRASFPKHSHRSVTFSIIISLLHRFKPPFILATFPWSLITSLTPSYIPSLPSHSTRNLPHSLEQSSSILRRCHQALWRRNYHCST